MESKTFRNSMLCVLALLLTLAFSLQPAGAQSGDSPFKGQTITIIAGSSPGGGTDSLARLLSRNNKAQGEQPSGTGSMLRN